MYRQPGPEMKIGSSQCLTIRRCVMFITICNLISICGWYTISFSISNVALYWCSCNGNKWIWNPITLTMSLKWRRCYVSIYQQKWSMSHSIPICVCYASKFHNFCLLHIKVLQFAFSDPPQPLFHIPRMNQNFGCFLLIAAIFFLKSVSTKSFVQQKMLLPENRVFMPQV